MLNYSTKKTSMKRYKENFIDILNETASHFQENLGRGTNIKK